jgi:hypothetical protein
MGCPRELPITKIQVIPAINLSFLLSLYRNNTGLYGIMPDIPSFKELIKKVFLGVSITFHPE